jgi:signal transduction histidine kinase
MRCMHPARTPLLVRPEPPQHLDDRGAQSPDARNHRVYALDRSAPARDVYDSAEQTFFAIGLAASATLAELGAAGLADGTDRPESPHDAPRSVVEALGRVAALADMGAALIRQARMELGQPGGVNEDVVPRLRELVDGLEQRTRIDAELVQIGEPGRVPQQIAELLARTATAALARIEHISSATAVVLALKLDARSLTLTIQDDGVSGSTAGDDRAAHAELRRVATRVRRVGGVFVARAYAGGGFVVRVRLPRDP